MIEFFSGCDEARCVRCGATFTLDELEDTTYHGGDLIADEFGYLGQCPVCLSMIFSENVT